MKREVLKRVGGLLPESQGQNLVVTALHALSSLGSGHEARKLLSVANCADKDIRSPPLLDHILLYSLLHEGG